MEKMGQYEGKRSDLSSPCSSADTHALAVPHTETNTLQDRRIAAVTQHNVLKLNLSRFWSPLDEILFLQAITR